MQTSTLQVSKAGSTAQDARMFQDSLYPSLKVFCRPRPPADDFGKMFPHLPSFVEGQDPDGRVLDVWILRYWRSVVSARITLMVLEPVLCPSCSSEDVVKHG
nr:hypothetical protein [Myxacorys chilensis ATA2-1-KO14]